MKTSKLVDQIKALFDSELRNDRRRQDSLKEVLEQLKLKEHKLREKLETEDDAVQRKKLEKKIMLVHSQRRKGLSLLKSLGE